MFRRIRRFLLVALLLFSILTCQVEAVSTSATSAILMDVDSGRVLYEQNADAKMLIASTTKILTALVAIREGNLSDVVTIKREVMLTEGSSMYLQEGEQVTLETLLYGLLLCSGNDAAVAIADHVGGSQEGFVKMMNETARDLGMASSSFANPNGLDDENHYSTARDMARLAQAAVENETLMRIASTRSVSIGGRTMTNHNKLLSSVNGCLGLKTGYTRSAGRTLVSCAERNGQRLVAVTLQDGNDWADHQSLFDYGFSAYPAKQGAVLGQVVQRVAVEGGMSATAPLVAADSFAWPLGQGETLSTRVELDQSLTAPVSAGTKVGRAVFEVNGKEVGRVELLCGETVLPVVDTALETLKRGLF
ncbi:D-alanyl-D-alanine carboxypeptidase family protein [Oscillibacter sp.]|uniref:D-alanyl-D-alanine carboxypeptidase family protein n=1 Tax=Oscillibacter sp. TaxID=1945593 RepID=UPI00261DD1E7|nr:D-alanyl-D-alanine carboxypeptidase family protein [Oscillibacter sp.]MDD3346291.1 D-alanyl-D-alanine carboxypeptidase [Oscillibacter sp.]